MAFTSISLERVLYSGQGLWYFSKTNIDGDQDEYGSFPADAGSVLVLECVVRVTSIATMVANPELLGPLVVLQRDGVKDFVGATPWVRCGANQLAAHVKPDQAVLFAAGDGMNVLFSEVDTNAAPTGDLVVYVRGRSIRV